jgi:Cu+-exporting ATPase
MEKNTAIQAAPIASLSSSDEITAALTSVDVTRVVFVCAVASLWWPGRWHFFGHPSAIGLLAVLVGGYPIVKDAFEHMVRRRMTMELSMTIVAALAIDEVFTALVITAFVLAAEILEGFTLARGRRAIGDLIDSLPEQVRLRRDEGWVEVPLADVRVADSVMVRPGARIPVDGVVTGGESFVD